MAEMRELRTEWGEVRSEQTAFRSQGVDLWGTVTLPLPKRAPRLPGVVLVPGSAATDGDYTFPRMRLTLRDGALEPEEPPARDWAIKPFKEIAECLAASGFITLRYDKRGVGRSGGTQEEWTLDLLMADTVAGLALLKSRRDVDPERLSLIGHSEGGLIAAALAGELGYLCGLTLLATPLTPPHRLAIDQNEHLFRLAGYPEEEIAANRHQMETDHEAIRAGAFAQPAHGGLPTRHWASLIRHKPLPALRRVPHRTRVLLLNGGKDWQVPPSEALASYGALRTAGHPDVELHLFPTLDHFLLEEPGVSRPEGYFAHRRRLPRYLLQTLKDWLLRACG
jgi:alpha-beta hydrolase superfamily lysophospholipase